MNRFEHWFCSTSLWRYTTEKKLLPWLLAGSDLGDQVLEIGAGSGAATDGLRQRAARVTSLEYDHDCAARLAVRQRGAACGVLRGDAAMLPFPDGAFSAAIAVLVLHHLRSSAVQDQTFAEVHRVLRPGGVFLAFEIHDSWFHRISHVRSTFVPVPPASAFTRLTLAGFSRVLVDFQPSGYRVRALRAGNK